MLSDSGASTIRSTTPMPKISTVWHYRRIDLAGDLVAAAIVTAMLIPQALAYALLAGLPVYTGLYASIIPLLCYALLGSSSYLAIGPVAIISLMTASTIAHASSLTTISSVQLAVALAALSGLFLLLMGLLRMGFIANFLSHSVISGFITAAGLMIAIGQLQHIIGIKASGNTVVTLLPELVKQLPSMHSATAVIGLICIVALGWSRRGMRKLLLKLSIQPRVADILSRTGAVWVVLIVTAAVLLFHLEQRGVRTLGNIPTGIPALVLPLADAPRWPAELWRYMCVNALLISVITFVESIAMAQTLASKNYQRVSPNRELLGLGAANMGAAVSGAFPVAGGFARSAVNYEAGARTRCAGALTALGMALATLFLTGFLQHVPIAALAAIIIVSVVSLIDVDAIKTTWRYSRSDFVTLLATLVITLIVGVEWGIACGVLLSIGLYMYRTSRPHAAIVGQIPGTEHFRNYLRHPVILCESLLSIRIDASLYFANARFLEDFVSQQVTERPKVRDVVLQCTAVNDVDASALESLKTINYRLNNADVRLHLSEVKGPVMDKLRRSDLLEQLTGKVFLTHYQAALELAPQDTDRLPGHGPS